MNPKMNKGTKLLLERVEDKLSDTFIAASNLVIAAESSGVDLGVTGETTLVLELIADQHLASVQKLLEKRNELSLAERVASAIGDLKEVVANWKERGIFI